MGFGFFASLFCLSLFVKSSVSQQPNTDAYYASGFLRKMGAISSVTDDLSSSICSWKGISCDTQGKQHITALRASGLGLHGVIPDDTVGKLSNLQHLDLSSNGITGLSSDFWGLGASLKVLNLSFNKISGPLPNNIGNFGFMESLDLSHNNFLGEIPAAFGSLSGLRLVNLRSNRFSGTIPDDLFVCESLQSIDFSSNNLNGSLPVAMMTAFKKLRSLNLAKNEIQGQLPSFSGLESITHLNLSGNMFHGLVHGVLHKPLQVVDLSNNQLQGQISQVNLNSSLSWPTLVYLDLSRNKLSGEFLGNLIDAPSLNHLNLASNKFSHTKFPRLEKLPKLEYLNLSSTGLSGKIPTGISSLVSLVTLDLSGNDLIGHIPNLNTKNLKVLDLSWNNLTGEISQYLQKKLPGMERYNFSYNNLTLCSKKMSSSLLISAFLGSQNDCRIAPNPDLLKRKRTQHLWVKLILAITLATFVLVPGFLCITIMCRGRNRKRAAKQFAFKDDRNVSGPFSFQADSTAWASDVKASTSLPVVIFEKPLLNFTFADLLTATSHFSRGTLLAEGRFGPVYRGLLPCGIHVAIKVLVHGSAMTDVEAAMELERLGRIKHPNLVPLTGYCIAGDKRIAIYEYMENGNLQNLLHDLPLGIQAIEDWSNDTWEDNNHGVQSITSEGQTTWRLRHKIALGSARALAFLHHGCFPEIIHRDVKASSIYLDSALEARLSDFGLAKIVGSGLEDEIGRGSPGYTPPEFLGTEPCSATSKTDIYGFGVVLFELITGKKPIGDDYEEEKDGNLVDWVRGLVRKNQVSRAIDPKIWGTGSEKQMEEALRIGYLCTADMPSKRPSMQQIVGLLKDIEPGVVDQ